MNNIKTILTQVKIFSILFCNKIENKLNFYNIKFYVALYYNR